MVAADTSQATFPTVESAAHVIRLAEQADVEPIRRFIDAHWKKGHILARDAEFFAYEHVLGNRVNFALAIDKARGNIAATLGFLKSVERYEGADAFTVIWKVEERSGDTTLGLRLLHYVERELGFASVSSVGINAATVPIYRHLGFEVGALRHHYMLNPSARAFTVAKIVGPPTRGRMSRHGGGLREFTTYDELRSRLVVEDICGVPRKDGWHVRRRYFEHPVHSYRAFGIEVGEQVRALLIVREVSANGGKVLRIVDVIGDDRALAGVGRALLDLVIAGGYEYVDLYEHGLDAGAVAAAGLTLRTPEDPNVIPNYFAPFVQQNVELLFFTSLAGARFLRGDGDQDRPT
jgi:hypothetical protein